MVRSATTASSAARNAAVTSSIDDTGYDSGSGLPVDGSIALNDPDGLTGCRHSPAIRTGSSAMVLLHPVCERHVADGDADDVSVREREVLARNDARSGRQERALRKLELHEQIARQLVERALDLRRARLAREHGASAPVDLHRDRQLLQPVRVADVQALTGRRRAGR